MASYKRQINEFELLSAKKATKLSKLQKLALIKSRDEIVTKTVQIVALMNEGAVVEANVLRTQLNNLVNEMFNGLTKSQVQDLSNHLINVYQTSRVSIGKLVGASFDVTNKFQAQELLNRAEDGITLSQRLYHNNKVIADRVNKDISRLVYNKADATEIRKAIAADYNISYNAADRLIRTETAKFYTNAARDSYKDAGIEQIEFLAEANACAEQCQPNNGKLFPIGDTSTLPPLHPNCRCVILPVIKD